MSGRRPCEQAQEQSRAACASSRLLACSAEDREWIEEAVRTVKRRTLCVAILASGFLALTLALCWRCVSQKKKKSKVCLSFSEALGRAGVETAELAEICFLLADFFCFLCRGVCAHSDHLLFLSEATSTRRLDLRSLPSS